MACQGWWVGTGLNPTLAEVPMSMLLERPDQTDSVETLLYMSLALTFGTGLFRRMITQFAGGYRVVQASPVFPRMPISFG